MNDKLTQKHKIINYQFKCNLNLFVRNLQTLVKCITLRRTKTSEVNGRPLVWLPEKSVCVEQVELSASEREEYELAHNEGRHTIGRYVDFFFFLNQKQQRKKFCFFCPSSVGEVVE